MRARVIVCLAAAGLLAFAACGGKAPGPMSTTPPSRNVEGADDAAGDAGEAPASMDQRNPEIETLMSEIEKYGQQMGIRLGAGDDLPDVEACDGSGSSVCEDTCKLAANICNNSERICQLSEELAGNAWASDQCDSAKGSCKRAMAECCECAG